MSQIQKLFDGTVLPDIETITGNSGGAVGPTLGNINITGSQGINIVGNPGTHTLDVSLSEPKISGVATTIGAVTADPITFVLATGPGIFTFDAQISGFDSANNLGVGYTLVGAVRTDGITAFLLPGQSLDQFEETGLSAANVQIVVSGNTAIFRVTGVVAHTISWTVTTEYLFGA